MTVQVDYINYDEDIKSVKIPIEKDIYQIIKPVIKEVSINGQTEIERYIEVAIHDDRLSNITIKKYSQKEMLAHIRILQRMVKEIMHDSTQNNLGCK